MKYMQSPVEEEFRVSEKIENWIWTLVLFHS